MSGPASGVDGPRMSGVELDAFTRFVEALFPVDAPFDLRGWGTAVGAAYADLVGAPHASMLLTLEGGQVYLPWNIPPEAYEDYARNYFDIDEARDALTGVGETALSTRELIREQGFDLETYRRTASFEWAHRYGLAFGVGSFDAVSASGYSGVMAYGGRQGADFGTPHQVAMARLCLRPFQAAVRSLRAIRRARTKLVRVVDSLETGIQLANAAGVVIHRNAVLRGMLRSDAEREGLTAALGQMAASLGRRVAGKEPVDPSNPPGLRRVSTANGDYELWGTVVPEVDVGGGPLLVLGVRSLRPQVMSPRELEERFGLTRRETQVAHLLARGASNTRIVKELDVRPSTARRHTEHVMSKLGVRSRAEIPAKVLRSS